jgi:N-methylhydantoinase B
VYYVLKAVLDPDLPANAGAYRPVEIVVRDGSLLSAQYPSAVCNANIITTQRIVDVLIGALYQAVPDRVLAASSGTMNLLNIGGVDPRSGDYFQYIETYAGGQGAMHDQDGMDAVQNHMTNTRNAPVEAIEIAYPLRVESYGLVPDSEGPGEHRGGVGMQRALRVLGKEVQLTLSSDRAEVAPWGLSGGRPGAVSRCRIIGADGAERSLPSKVTTFVPGDDIVVNVTPGGGGWGRPKRRDPQAVRWDVMEGLISPERARDVYGVSIDPATMRVDEAETRALREREGADDGEDG